MERSMCSDWHESSEPVTASADRIRITDPLGAMKVLYSSATRRFNFIDDRWVSMGMCERTSDMLWHKGVINKVESMMRWTGRGENRMHGKMDQKNHFMRRNEVKRASESEWHVGRVVTIGNGLIQVRDKWTRR